MADFQKAFAKAIELEGGFVDDENDPGGATNFGISLRWLQKEGDLELGDIDNDGDIDYQDIKEMSLRDAAALYKEHWWDKYGYESIPNQPLANKIFDMSINMGARQAHRLLQRAINNTLGNIVLVDDGILGQKSSQAMGIAIQQPLALVAALRAQQEGFYRLLASQKPDLAKFLRGWLNRANS